MSVKRSWFEPEEPPPFHRPELYLKAMESVIGQESLKMKLASVMSQYTLFLHGKTIKKPAMLIYGESGSGKTFSVELLSEFTGLPFSSFSCSALSMSSYKGLTLRDMLAQFLEEHKSTRGIIFLDEVDKWCRYLIGSDNEQLATKTALQHEALRMMESETVVLSDEMEMEKDDTRHDITVDTSQLLWIFAGAFVGLDRFVQRRLHNIYLPKDEIWSEVTQKDFIDYGLSPEFAGRIQTYAWTKPLKRQEQVQILLDQEVPNWKVLFKAIGCTLEIQEGALYRCVEHAEGQKTGVRGAMAALRRSMNDVYVRASEHKVKHVYVDTGVIQTGRLEIEGVA